MDKSLVLVHIQDGWWFTARPFTYASLYLEHPVCVPSGFATDLATVPKIPIIYELFQGKGSAASVVHDYLYWAQPTNVTRKLADKIFYEAMIRFGTDKHIAFLMWAAVRICGLRIWLKHKRSNRRWG